ncbi:MAG: leucine-rich repeat protein [Lachnospiraceae bacterium]
MANYTFADGVLTLYGNEIETDYTSSTRPVWENEIEGFAGLLKSVVFQCNINRIGNYVFSNCWTLESITIPEGVISIGEYAFYSCSSLYEIILPSTLKTIESYAFSSSSCATEITIPEGVETIGNYAFFGFDSLYEVTIPSTVTLIGDSAFYCYCLTDIYILSSDTEIYDSVDTISQDATIHGPANSTAQAYAEKYSRAFLRSDDNIISIEITSLPDRMNYVTGESFDKTGLVVSALWQYSGKIEINIYDCTISGFDSTTDGEKTIEITYQTFATSFVVNVKRATWTFADGVLTLRENEVEVIEANYYYGKYPVWEKEVENFKQLLTSVVFECNISKIGNNIFESCVSLSTIAIPESVREIGDTAFYKCTSLESITIPEGVEIIGNSAFYLCGSLSEITIPESVTTIGKYVFFRCSSLNKITIPEGVEIIDKETFSGCSSLISVNIPLSVTTICDNAFYECTKLSNIVIPSNVTSIGKNVFYKCSSLNSIILPDGITVIKEGTFYNCTELSNVIIPSGVLSIEMDAFYNCNSLAEVTVPNSVTTIGNRAFRSDYLEKIHILNPNVEIYDSKYTISSSAIIYGPANSTAQAYAEKYSRTFVASENVYVKFIDYNGDVLKEEIIPLNSDATPPDTPNRDGYRFIGWDKSYTNITADIEITAQYIKVHVVAFYGFGGILLESKQVDHGSKVTPPTPEEITGYTLTEWKDFDSSATLDLSNITRDMRIHAIYTLNRYTVRFLNRDGTIVKSQSVEHGKGATAPKNPSSVGYYFIGWDKDFSNITENVDIYALYDFEAVIMIPSKITLYEGETTNINIDVGPEGILDKNITVSVYPEGIITYDNGVITALQPREATVIVTHTTQGVTALAYVKVFKTQETKEEYKNAIANNNRGVWDAKVTVGGKEIPKEYIEKIEINEREFQTGKLGIGSVASSYAEISFRNKGITFTNKAITISIGMMVENICHYVVFPTFYVTDTSGLEEDEIISVTAYDSMKKTGKKYSTSLNYPSNIQLVTEEIADLCGLKLYLKNIYPDITIEKAIEVETCRDALKVIAQLLGTNAVINREDELEFRFLKETDIVLDSDSRYYYFRKSDMDSRIASVKIANSDETFTSSSTAKSSRASEAENKIELSFANEYANQEIADNIMKNVDICYRPGELSFIGDPSICVGDIVTVKDKNGKTYKYPVMENTIIYDGGVKNNAQAYSESETEQEFTKKTSSDKIYENNNKISTIWKDVYGTKTDSGNYSGGIVDKIYGTVDPSTGERIGGLLKCVSCTELPENPDANTIYLIQGEVTVN